MRDAGALELNLYSVATDPRVAAADRVREWEHRADDAKPTASGTPPSRRADRPCRMEVPRDPAVRPLTPGPEWWRLGARRKEAISP
jgi:hypothetical protein